MYRRSLRIFPIYFLLLLIGALFSLSNFLNLWPYLVFYLPNFYIMAKGTWLGIWDHLWSLAVEEQYYLIFPYFIFLFTQRRYPILFLLMLLIGLGIRFGFYALVSPGLQENNWMWWYVNPFAALDCFGVGGVLAYLFHYRPTYFNSLKYLRVGLFISILVFVLILNLAKYSVFPHANIFSIVFERFAGALLAFFLIALSIRKEPWFLSSFLQFKWVSYLGQISYGIYLYHNLVMNYYHDKGNTIWYYLNSHLPDFHLELVNFTLYRFFISTVLVICLSSLSWFLIEKPINKYKNRI